MAVVVQCFQCNAVIELDEGFRGGVCRCSGCGTLLQVPRGEVEQAKRKSRPANPGVKSSTGVPAAASGEPGLSRGALQRTDRPDETAATADAGGSSSSLRPVHPTRPIGAIPEAAATDKPAEASPPPAPEPGSEPPILPRRQELRDEEVRQNNKLLRTAWLLFVLLAIIILMSVAIYWSRGDQDNSGSTTPSPHPATTPPGSR